MTITPRLAVLPLLLLTSVATAQEASAPPPGPAPSPSSTQGRTVPVVLATAAGPITIAVEVERAPITAANFLRYVDQKRFDGTSFYRAYTYGNGTKGGLIQGGTKNDPKRNLKPVAHEPTSATGLSHDDGAVSMARGAPGSATGDFFIIMDGMKGLDADPAAPGDNQGYAVFGHVVAGMDAVRAIAADPRDPTAGVGAMKGQMLAKPVRIETARRGAAQ